MTAEIDATRLWQTILETARIGATERGGVCRLTLSDEDRRVRDWFVEACEHEGCRVTVDEMSNIFARRRVVWIRVPTPRDCSQVSSLTAR